MSTGPEEPLFNQVTDLVDKANYARDIAENEDMYQYMTTSFNQPICFMQGKALQGFSTKETPSALIDVETYLRRQPYADEIDQNVFTGDIRNTTPSMPEELKTRLMIPECGDLIETTYHRDRQADVGFNRESQWGDTQWTHGGPQLQTHLASIGIDTRQAMKDAYKRRTEQKLKGMWGKDASNLTPMPETPCRVGDSRNCMHLGGPEAHSQGSATIKTFQPSVPLGVHSEHLSMGPAPANSVIPEVPVLPLSSEGPKLHVTSTQTPQSVLNLFPPEMTLREHVQEAATRRGCQVGFLAYKPRCA